MKEGNHTPSSRLKWGLAALLALALTRLWLQPLASSFWVDEMATVFVVERGAGHPSFAAAPQVPASIYYALPRASAALFGSSEAAYRIPSVLAMGLALFVIFRLARRLIHPDSGWFAVFACLALTGINYQAVDARPYALGTLVSAVGVLFLVRWLDGGRWRDGLLFGLSAALLWRVHLIFWPFYMVYTAYAALRLLRKESRASWKQAATVFGLIAASLVPVLLEAVDLLREAGEHVIAKPPSLHEFEHRLRWNVPLIFGAGAWILTRVCRWKREPLRLPGSALLLIAGWWLVQPAALFAFSWITGNSVFVPRYYFLMLPGVALAATAAAAHFFPSRAPWRKLALLVGAGALLWIGDWGRLWPVHERSDWRAAASRVNELAGASGALVVCPSPFIEARPPVWSPDYPLPGFFYSHLPVYPIRARTLLFPFDKSPEAERYAGKVAGDAALHSRNLVLYGSDGAVRLWREWFARSPEMAGWSFRREQFGDVDVVELRRP